MWLRSPQALVCALAAVLAFSSAYGLTHQEIVAKLEAAGYSQIRANGSGKILTFKAVRNGKEVSLVVDTFGQIKELPH